MSTVAAAHHEQPRPRTVRTGIPTGTGPVSGPRLQVRPNFSYRHSMNKHEVPSPSEHGTKCERCGKGLGHGPPPLCNSCSLTDILNVRSHLNPNETELDHEYRAELVRKLDAIVEHLEPTMMIKVPAWMLKSAADAIRPNANTAPTGQSPEPCDVCLGQPLASGKKCICGGVGTRQAELHGLRQLCFDQQTALDRIWEVCDSDAADKNPQRAIETVADIVSDFESTETQRQDGNT